MVLVEPGVDDPARMMADGRVVKSSSLATSRAVPAIKTSGPLRLQDIRPQVQAQIGAGLPDARQHANDPPRDKLPADAQRMRAWALGRVGHVLAAVNPFENEELAALRTRDHTELNSLDSLPLIVIARGRPEETGPDAAALEQQHKDDLAVIAARSRRGRMIIAVNSSHHVQLEEPEVVVRAIKEVTSLARK
jgi:pimeloyl-ACP methyl ester carboxylesterase